MEGRGHYVGTHMAWGVNNNGWWGEGEIKFFIDGDQEYPTICGTGTEDYFCGSYDFEDPVTHARYDTIFYDIIRLTTVIEQSALHSSFRFGIVPLAPDGSNPFRAGSPRDDPGVGCWRSREQYRRPR